MKGANKMTIKEFMDSKTNAELKQFSIEMNNWLGSYTQPIINKVAAKIEDIINNEIVMKMIHELYIRTIDKQAKQAEALMFLFKDYEGFKQYDIHNQPLAHPESYRAVLYDMYIKDIKID